jgi:MFS family permease
VSRVGDVIAPTRLGTNFRWLMASSWVTNIGDGIALAAGPLLVASQTREPVLVALAALLQRLPWLLLGLVAGAIADRLDRRVVVMAVDTLRAAILGALSWMIWRDHVDITVVLAAMFALGVAEVFADTTSGTLLPMFVEKQDLGVANARLQAGFLTANQLVGPPVGAMLFGLGMAWPFVTQAVTTLLGVLLVSRIALPKGGVREYAGTHVRQDIVDGVRWLLGHAAIRTLAIVMFTFNVTWGAAWSVLVLYSLDRLHMGEVGFGLLTTVAALGGIASTASYGWLERRVPLGTLMRGCLLLEVMTHLGLAVTTTGWVALLIMFVFGAYAFVWGALSSSVRQRAVPTQFQGRVSSVYLVGLFGGLVIGQALGGPIADHWGLTGPFWFAFFGAGLTLALVWRQLPRIAHAEG